jgi:hypothetical protein
MLQLKKLEDLGEMAAKLDFQLVSKHTNMCFVFGFFFFFKFWYPRKIIRKKPTGFFKI